MPNALLPCPFCGTKPHLGCDDFSIRASQKYFIECQCLDCLMPDMEDLSYDALVAAWNRRTPSGCGPIGETE